jgi:MFS family permease
LRRYLDATFSALAVQDYRRFAFGQTISVSGTWMQKLAQAWLVLELTGSPVLLGVTVAMQQVPTLLFTIIGGALADRFDKRTLLLWSAAGGAVPALSVAVLVQADLIQIWMLLVAAFTQGLVDAVEKPARLTFVNDIATPATLTNAVMLNGIIQDSGKLVGPAVAGIMIGSFGLAPAFFVNAASYVPVIVAMLLIHPHEPLVPARPFRARGNFTGTLRYVAGEPRLAATLILMTVAGLLAYNWNVLLPTLVHETFGGDATKVGFAFTTMGLGAVLGGLALAGVLKASTRLHVAVGLVFGCVLTGVGFAPNLGVAFVLIFFLGAASVTFRAIANSLLQLSSDPLMRGRVISLLVLSTAGMTPLGGPLIGWICEHASAQVACFVGGVGTALAAVAARVYLVTRKASDAPVAPTARADPAETATAGQRVALLADEVS